MGSTVGAIALARTYRHSVGPAGPSFGEPRRLMPRLWLTVGGHDPQGSHPRWPVAPLDEAPLTLRTQPRSRFLLHLSLAFLAIALAGFSTTLFIPLARGSFTAPFPVQIHGVLMFCWLLLLIGQTALVSSGKTGVHRRLGWLGAALAVAIVPSGVASGVYATRRDLAATEATWPYGGFVNIVIEMAVFGILVAAAIAQRRQPERHKRLLVLATISALGPAWFRFRHFMPFVPNPIVTFSLVADSVLLVLIAREWLKERRVHPVFAWAGGAMVAVHLLELAAAESPLWTGIGRWLLQGMPA